MENNRRQEKSYRRMTFMKPSSDVAKFDAQFPFRMSSSALAALQRIARAKNKDPQDLMRIAAEAIVEYAAVNGDKNVPLDMAITQRLSPPNPMALGEGAARYADAPTATEAEILRELQRLREQVAGQAGNRKAEGGGAGKRRRRTGGHAPSQPSEQGA
jgi:hypothetical protein